MRIRVLCPEGHPVSVAADKIGGVVFCPECYTSFQAELADSTVRNARKGGSKSKHARDDDDEDDEEDEKPVRKNPRKKEDDEEEDEKPRKKPVKAKKRDDDDEEDDDEEDDEKPEEDETIDWTKKKRQLAIVNTGLIAYLVSFYIMGALFSVMVLCAVPWIIMLVFAHFVFSQGPGGQSDTSLADLFLQITYWAVAVFAGPIYISQIVGWVTGLFSPAKLEGRGVCIAALLLVLFPILLYAIYAIFRYAVIQERMEISTKMFNMFNGFAFAFVMMALYAGLIYVGKVAGFMGMSMEKHKPSALGWFIVGGSVLLAGCILLLVLRNDDTAKTTVVPWWSLYIIGGLTFAIYFFVLTGLRELIQTVIKIRAVIEDYIKYG